MLAKFRSVARGIGSKILMALLILTFAVWGIGDMMRKSSSNVTVATVGDIKISYLEYQHALRNETEKLRQMLGKNATPEILKNLNIEPQVLQHMVDERLLKLESKKIGLRVSDEDVANNIRKNPAFLDDKGKFSKQHFEYFLRSNGQTEKMYIEKTRDDMAVNLLLTPIISTSRIPENAISMLLSSREEQRKIDVYTISSSLINSAPTPDKSQLQEYYDSNIAEFTAPEYRTLSYMLLTADDAKKLSKKSDKNTLGNKDNTGNRDIETIYHERIDEFKKPERRKVDQLLFANEDVARKAYEIIKTGKSFEEVGKDSNLLNPKTISLGLVEKSNILEAASEKVFSLDVGAASEPIQSSFGWHIFRVKEIISAATQPLEEVRPLLEKDLEQQANEDSITDLTKRIDDAIAGGSTLAEVAKEFELKITTLSAIDKNGKLLDGTIEKDIPKDEAFLETAFKTDEKTESAIINGKDGSKYMIRVESITPEHVLPLEEVKTKLVVAWTTQENKKQLAELAKKISVDFATAASRENAIKKYSLSTPSTLTISQKNNDKKLLVTIPDPMIKDIFSKLSGGASSAFAQENGHSYSIAVIKEIIPVTHNEKDSKYNATKSNIGTEYGNSMRDEIVQQYLHFLAKKHPLSINLPALQMKSDE